MVRTCCVSGCKNNSTLRSISFHSFPKDPARREDWCSFIAKINKVGWKPSNHQTICSAHFEESSFDRTGQTTRIRANAIPCKFKNQETQLPLKVHIASNTATETSYVTAIPVSEECDPCTSGICLERSSTPNQRGEKRKASSATHIQETPKLIAVEGPNHVNSLSITSINDSITGRDSLFTSSTPLRSLAVANVSRHRINSPGEEINCRRLKFNESISTGSSCESGSNSIPMPTQASSAQPTNSLSTSLGSRSSVDTSSSLSLNVDVHTSTDETSTNSECSNLSSETLEDTPRKVRLKVKLQRLRRQIQQTQKKVRLLQQNIRRKGKKIASLQNVVEDLESKHLLSEDGLYILKKSLPQETSALIDRISSNNKRGKFSPELRAFALTLHFYSPAAYDYVRTKFNMCLPEPRTIRAWCSSVNGEPGFIAEAFKTLKTIAEKHPDKYADAALIVDEMSIKQFIEYDGKKVVGYVDMGIENVTDDSLPEATQSCVFMVVGLKERFKVPCAYFLINSLTGAERANLAKQCIEKLYDVGIKIHSLTFDGCGANLKMISALGCNFDADKPVTSFTHPACDMQIFAFPDACHMLKLIRNCLADKKIIIDESGCSILWTYIEQLQTLQANEGLKLANKLSKAHIEWYKKKMNVRLAAQTLSSSVADALEFCEQKLKLKEFKDVEATVTFIRIFDRLFDLLNSRNPLASGYKAPISSYNIDSINKFCTEAEKYILSLKDDIGNPITKSCRKTGFVGFLFCIKSVLGLYKQLVENKTQNYLLTYKVSQDSLELFFGCIRRHCGCNNNPTPRQFKAIFRKLLISNEVRMRNRGNCLVLNDVDILTVSSMKSNESSKDDLALDFGEIDDDTGDIIDHNYCIEKFSSELLSTYAGHVIPYIAGYVVLSIEKKINCVPCQDALRGDTAYALIVQKNCGGLVSPSQDVVKICLDTEKCFLYYYRKYENVNIICKYKKFIVMDVMNRVTKSVSFKCLNDHIKDLEPLDNHIYSLSKAVCEMYLRIRFFHALKIEQAKTTKPSNRNILSRLIINKHQ